MDVVTAAVHWWLSLESAETSQICKINRPAIKCNIFWQSPYLSVTESRRAPTIARMRKDLKLFFSELGWTETEQRLYQSLGSDYKLRVKCVMRRVTGDQGWLFVPALPLCRHQSNISQINIARLNGLAVSFGLLSAGDIKVENQAYV